MTREKLKEVQHGDTIFVAFKVDDVNLRDGTVTAYMPFVKEKPGVHVVGDFLFDCRDISSFRKARRKFKCSDFVNHHGFPCIVDSDEDEYGLVKLCENEMRVKHNELKLLLPAEKVNALLNGKKIEL